ncbi:oligopeptidase b [Trypanosoma cruzi]|uniref:Prolyl endopeptidase n=1 Tax=Trypanosoma cruzi TaxID=5693 RepID=A0A2V2W663_TRYCR|nr:oligopeptidase b [Trypanosoma cruzi]
MRKKKTKDVPTVFIECALEGEGEKLCVRWLFGMGVGGKPYDADEYDATIVWVPSDYAFHGDKFTSPLRPIPTKNPVAVVRIPVYLCRKKALRSCGGNPMLLSVYGSYGECCDVVFENERLSLLDRGFVWGFAAVCGGSELGAAWHKAGCGLQRATSVNDFVSVSFYVQETGWCAAGQIVTHGSSAGVFVATAAMCVAPSLPLAVIALVPCVDCLTTLMDDSLPLTVSNWEEFGNPRDDADAYRLLRAMLPMDNIPSVGVALPHMLLLTAWHDTRVGFWESLAFTARLRAREMEEGAATR